MFGVVKVLPIQTPFTVRTTLKGKRSGLHQKIHVYIWKELKLSVHIVDDRVSLS